ncbi:26S proteasome non-ATPase regulatory subunit 1-like protein [Tanacetum coccineum]|uniref:26S proteasome non-ATPase regulatory subunit 1-like protein n=1 Tax=Tanacetum coccineum TaxID=301880 RepID=A0ABQ5INP3_9ASTR
MVRQAAMSSFQIGSNVDIGQSGPLIGSSIASIQKSAAPERYLDTYQERRAAAAPAAESRAAATAAMRKEDVGNSDDRSQPYVTGGLKIGDMVDDVALILEDVYFVVANGDDKAGFGDVYKGQSSKSWQHYTTAIKCLNQKGGKGKEEICNELELIFMYHHENIINFLGHSDVDNEMIIVNEYGINDSLDGYLEGTNKRHNLTQVGSSYSQDYKAIARDEEQCLPQCNNICKCTHACWNYRGHISKGESGRYYTNLQLAKPQTGLNTMSHLQQGRSLMAPYLPQIGSGSGDSASSEGGALYALGLIHANNGEGIKQFLRDSLRSTSVEVVHHGACLGLGLDALGTADEDIYDEIKSVLYTDSAVAGEASGISMGLLMVGTANEKASEMGLALGIALTVYGREEEADTLIEQMTRDQDLILRYGGMYAFGLANAGTTNNKAIR